MFGNRRLLPINRRLVTDLLFFSKRIPHQALTRYCDLSRLCEIKRSLSSHVGWAALFVKAYSHLAQRHPNLRQSYMPWPVAHLYQHPANIARLSVSREYNGEECVFYARIHQPEKLSIVELQQSIQRWKSAPVESIINYRRQWNVARLPTLIRRLLWWMTLNISGRIREGRFGTFVLTTVASEGAVSIHPPSVVGTTLTYGPVAEDGSVRITVVYDHRIIDGAFVARVLQELEQELNGPICDELASENQIFSGATQHR